MEGQVNEIFVTNLRKDRLWFAVCAAAVLLGLFILRLPVWLPPRREASWLDALFFPALICLFIAVPFLIVFFFRAFLHMSQRLEVNADGIVLTRRGKTRRYTWDDITDVVVSEKDAGEQAGAAAGEQLGGAVGGFLGGVLAFYAARFLGEAFSGKMDTRTTTTMLIQTSDGEKYRFDRRMSPWFRLLELLPETIRRVWSERYIQHMANNEDVSLQDSKGALIAMLTTTTLANHQQAIPWDAAQSVTYEEGQLAVRTSQPGLYSLRFQLEGGSVRGKALADTIRAKAPAVREALERQQKLAAKPLWNPRSPE
jgi:hypothetical protein